MSINPPKEGTVEYDEAIAEWEANEYKRSRADKYPPIGDQLDMIFRAGLGGDEFQATIQAVKDKYPKGDA